MFFVIFSDLGSNLLKYKHFTSFFQKVQQEKVEIKVAFVCGVYSLCCWARDKALSKKQKINNWLLFPNVLFLVRIKCLWNTRSVDERA